MNTDDLERMYSFIASRPDGVSEPDIIKRGFKGYRELIAELEDAGRIRHSVEPYRGVIFRAMHRRG